jgi:hypothetical protein
VIERSGGLGPDGRDTIDESLLPVIDELPKLGGGDDDEDADADDDADDRGSRGKGKGKPTGKGKGKLADDDDDDDDRGLAKAAAGTTMTKTRTMRTTTAAAAARARPPARASRPARARASRPTMTMTMATMTTMTTAAPAAATTATTTMATTAATTTTTATTTATTTIASRRPGRRRDRDDRDDRDDDDGDRDAAPTGFAAVDLAAGLSFTGRTLAFTTNLTENAPQGYRGAPVPGIRVAAEVFPLALNRKNRSVTKNLGVTALFDRVVAISSEVRSTTMTYKLDTTEQHLAVGLVYRHPLSAALALEGSVRWNKRTFAIDKGAAPADAVDIPNTDYSYVDPGVGVHLRARRQGRARRPTRGSCSSPTPARCSRSISTARRR